MRNGNVVVAGSNTVDIYVETEADLISITYPRQGSDSHEELLGYPLGDKILAEHAQTSIGGSGVNAATAFSRAGFDTHYLGCIGDDMFGVEVFKHLREESIHFQGSLGAQNGLGIILESQAADRTILSYKGCNSDLSRADVQDYNDPDVFYTSTVMGETRETITDLLSSTQAVTAVNTSLYLARQGTEGLEDLLGHADYVFLNEEEARAMTDEDEPKAILNAINNAARGQAVITAGGDGVYYDGAPAKHMPARADTVVDTTGAGDAFNTGFLIAVTQDKGLDDAVTAGMIQAEHILQHEGTTEDLQSQEQLFQALSNDTREPTVIR